LTLWLVISLAVQPAHAPAAEPSREPIDLDLNLGDGYRHIGKIQPRHARDITASNWSIGAETMDRDYTVYAHWREHLGPLGAKKARIQSGWAKTEQQRGVYDWDWVDEIVLDMVDQGVEPWVCLCYGNPIYPGGGDTGLGGGLVSSEEALQAWERYVAAFVARYKQHVDEWELWNEPRTGRGKGTVLYGEFVVRTAETIRKIQPDAEIMFAAGGSFDTTFAKEVLEYLLEQDKLALVNTIIYHPYQYNPDESYGAALGLRKIAKSFAPHIDIRQGENGAPSRPGSFGALSGNDWTERAQAKWALRRLLGDLGRDIPSSYFAICDMRYPSRVNYKGLLAINADKTVRHKKLGYYAVQHLTALFDDTVKRVKGFSAEVTSGAEDSRFSVFGYRGPQGGTLVTLWRRSDTPDKKPDFERVTLNVHSGLIQDPVWVDLLTGRVYAIDDARWRITLQGMMFTDFPVYDSVVVVADRREIERVLTTAKPTAAEDTSRGPVLESTVTIHNSVALSGVELAVADLANDLEKVLGAAAKVAESEDADLVIRLDDSVGGAESYRIDIEEDRVLISGADELGVIYGMYRFSHDVLGVDPFWYFKDLEPEPRARIPVAIGTIRSKPPTFRYRGWFVNDEDLLTEWKDGGGKRHIGYPFYHQVVRIEVIDRVFEALLRAGGNLIIPASFVDVMNEPEAGLVRQAAQRSLYVSQHHIEPLGVSHYGFENYWKAKGQQYPFAYGSHPERVREVWRAFAVRWRELAGDKVVWQLGLRGKGDTAIWNSDKTVNRSQAGTIISQAIVEQRDIVRSVDPRPKPPMTITLWLEGSALMSAGSLTFPKGITIVFTDHGPSQKMQPDFHSTRRTEQFGFGAYYHIGFWGTGPHLLQGSKPQRIREEFDRIIAKGDTDYAVINVCNVREHVLGIQAATEIMTDRDGWSEAAFWDRFAPPILHEPYRVLLTNLFPLNGERIMQDGALFAAARKLLARYAAGERKHGVLGAATVSERKRQLAGAIASLDALVADYPAGELTARQRAFYDVHFLTQAKMWRELYAFYLALIKTSDDPSRLDDAESALERFLAVRENAATGKWEGWYRGDTKVNVPAFLRATQAARAKLRGAPDG
jgi:hypothetical protein